MITINSVIIPLHGSGESKIGGRSENQDDFGFYDTPVGFLAIVCDGMGGGPGGKTASYIAKYEILTALKECNPDTPRENALKMGCARAHEALAKKMEQVPSLVGMGSTFVAVLINKDSMLIAHAGDSRCYVFRGKRCIYRSRDHSLVAELVKSKALTEEEARKSPQSNIITRGLGSVSNNVPEFDEIKYKKGDRIVLCTDGVWGSMPAKDLALRLTNGIDLASITSNLSSEVDNIGFVGGGHHDNHTFMVIDLDVDSNHAASRDSRKMMVYGGAILGACVVMALLCFFFFKFKKDNHVAENGVATAPSETAISPLPGYAATPLDVDSSQEDEAASDSVKDASLLNQLDSLVKVVKDSVGRIKTIDGAENPDVGKESDNQNGDIAEDNGSGNGNKIIKKPSTPEEVISMLIEELDAAKNLSAPDSRQGAEELENYQKRAKDLAQLSLLDSLNHDGKAKMRSVKSNLQKNWYIDKTKNSKGKNEVTKSTKDLLQATIDLLKEIDEDLNFKQ